MFESIWIFMCSSNRKKRKSAYLLHPVILLFLSSLNDTNILYKFLQKCPKAVMHKPYINKYTNMYLRLYVCTWTYNYLYVCMYICVKILKKMFIIKLERFPKNYNISPSFLNNHNFSLMYVSICI